jgi:hypothetical protein
MQRPRLVVLVLVLAAALAPLPSSAATFAPTAGSPAGLIGAVTIWQPWDLLWQWFGGSRINCGGSADPYGGCQAGASGATQPNAGGRQPLEGGGSRINCGGSADPLGGCQPNAPGATQPKAGGRQARPSSVSGTGQHRDRS